MKYSEFIEVNSGCLNINDNHIQLSYKDKLEKDIAEGRKHYVLWSGGTDSTLLLYELLDTYGSENVTAVSYIYPWLNKNKVESEFFHRESFKSKMKCRGEKYSKFNHVEFNFNQRALEGNILQAFNTPYGSPQAVSWLLAITIHAANNSYIYDGGNIGDTLTVHLKSYYKLFDGIAETLDKNIILRQPYIYFNKTMILEKLMKYDLYDESWYCEMPGGVNVPCYKCHPCKTHISASEDDYIRAKAFRILGHIYETIEKNKEKNNEINLISHSDN